MRTIDDTIGRRRAWTWVPQESRVCMSCGQLRRRPWSAYCLSCEPAIDGFMIRANTTMVAATKTVRRFVREFERTRGRAPEPVEILALLDRIHPQHIMEAVRLEVMQPIPLHEIEDVLVDESAPGLTELTLRGLLYREVHRVLRTLSNRERLVLQLRFGMTEDRCPRTLEEVGAFFKVTRARVREIEAKALRRLRHPTRTRRLRRFYDPAHDRGDVDGFPYQLPARKAGEHTYQRTKEEARR